MRWVLLVLGLGASALMFQAALPPVGASPLGWVCFVPTLIACRGRGFAVGFATGLFAIMLAACLARNGLWLKPSLVDGDEGWIYAGFALFGLPVGLLHGIVGEQQQTGKWTPALLAVWAVLFEATLLVYLPAHLALTQSRSTALLALASVTGIWGASLLCWMANLLVAHCVVAKDYKLAVLVGAGAMALSAPVPIGGGEGRGEQVTALQAPIEESEFFVEHTKGTQGRLGVIVWPEAAGVGIQTRRDASKLIELARETDSQFTTSYDDDFRPLPHNTMALFSPAGSSATYFKRKLFGGERSTHSSGSKSVASGTFGFNICFDSCFPYVMRETALLPGVSVILLPTLDPGSPFGVCQAIHAAYTPFRAAELGVTIVRADATAYSMIVGQRGQVLAQAGSGVRAAISAEVPDAARWTIYKQLGDWFLWVCGVVVVVMLVIKRRRIEPTDDGQVVGA